MNKTSIYRNIVITFFMAPVITSVLISMLALYSTFYVLSFVTEITWINYTYWLTAFTCISTTYIRMFFNSTYAALQRHDATITITPQTWWVIRIVCAIAYMGTFYIIFRSIYSPISSAAYALFLYGTFTTGIWWEKFWDKRRKKAILRSINQ